MGIVCGLILLQTDFSTAMLIGAVAVAMFFTAGADLRQMLVSGAIAAARARAAHPPRALPAGAGCAASMDPAADPTGSGYQIMQTLDAIMRGGVTGVGLGGGQQKHVLPAAHTDAMFAVLGEEIGLIGGAARAGAVRPSSRGAASASQRRAGPVRQPARRRHHLLDHGPGPDQHRGRHGVHAVHRHALAVRVVRRVEPDHLPGGHRASSEHLARTSIRRGRGSYAHLDLWRGTGGHVYPALTVLDSAGAEVTEVLWVGTADAASRRVIVAAPRRALPRRSPPGPLVGADRCASCAACSRSHAAPGRPGGSSAANRPDAVLRHRRLRQRAGRAGRAAAVGCRWPCTCPMCGRPCSSAHRPPGRPRGCRPLTRRWRTCRRPQDVVTGYPVRGAVRRGPRGRGARGARPEPRCPVVLVFGGSQGARRLNEAMADAAPTLLARARSSTSPAASTNRLGRSAPRTRCRPIWHRGTMLHAYLHDDDMAHALAAADLVVSRAGAAVMGEYPPAACRRSWCRCRSPAGTSAWKRGGARGGWRRRSRWTTPVGRPPVSRAAV